MTMINCSSDCKHQQDGKCMLEEAISETISMDAGCVFFEERHDRNKPALICKHFSE